MWSFKNALTFLYQAFRRFDCNTVFLWIWCSVTVSIYCRATYTQAQLIFEEYNNRGFTERCFYLRVWQFDATRRLDGSTISAASVVLVYRRNARMVDEIIQRSRRRWRAVVVGFIPDEKKFINKNLGKLVQFIMRWLTNFCAMGMFFFLALTTSFRLRTSPL